MHLQWSGTFSLKRVPHNPNEYETIVFVGISGYAMEPLWAFGSSIDTPNSFEHRFQCLYEFLATTQSFGLVSSFYTPWMHVKELLYYFFLGMMTPCPHKRQPSCTINSFLRVKYGWIVFWPALSVHSYWTKVNTLDTTGFRQVHRFMLLASISDESNDWATRIFLLELALTLKTSRSMVLRAWKFDISHPFQYSRAYSYADCYVE